jgi:hypothetical protein
MLSIQSPKTAENLVHTPKNRIECGEVEKGSKQPGQEPCTNVRRTQQYG